MHTSFMKWTKTLTTVLILVSIVLTGCTTPTANTSPNISYGPSGGNATITTAGNTTINVTKPTTAQVSNLNGAGGTFIAPLATKWFNVYNGLTSVKVNYQAIGSGAGITQFTAGTVDFGESDAIMTDAQMTAAVAAGGPVLHIPLTSGAVAITYNLPGINTETLKLTGDVLANIYLKKIKNWNDPAITALNPGISLPNTPIAVVHRSDGSGTSYIFTSYLSKVSPEWSSNIGFATAVNWPGDIGGQGNAGVAAQVQQIPGAIGYVEQAYAVQNNLPWALLKNAAGNYEKPSLNGVTQSTVGITLPDDMKVMITNSSNPDAYPICGFTWALVYQNQKNLAVGTSLVNMLWWAIHDGQQYSTALNYAPLSSDAVKKAENEIMSINYQGQPLLAH